MDDIKEYSREMALTIKVLLKNLGANLKQSGLPLTAEQFIYLKIIRMHPDTILQDLSEKLMRDKSQVMRDLDVLQAARLVARIPDPEDRRRKLLVLTAAGDQLFHKALEVQKTTLDHLTRGLSEESLSQFEHVLRTIRNNSNL